MTQSVAASEGNPEPNFATLSERFVAIAVDTVVLTLVTAPIACLGAWLTTFPAQFIAWCAAIVLPLGYYLVAHARYGVTVGKRVLRIRVESDAGCLPGWRRAAIREAPWILLALLELGIVWSVLAAGRWPHFFDDGNPGFITVSFLRLVLALVGAMTILATKRRRALHDFLAGTIVTRR